MGTGGCADPRTFRTSALCEHTIKVAQSSIVIDTRHELSQHEMGNLREIVDSARISRHLKNIQIGIVSGFAIFRSSTPNKFQRGYLSLLVVRLFSVFFLFLRTESKRSHRIPRSLAGRYAGFGVCHTCAYKEGTSGASERARQ